MSTSASKQGELKLGLSVLESMVSRHRREYRPLPKGPRRHHCAFCWQMEGLY